MGEWRLYLAVVRGSIPLARPISSVVWRFVKVKFRGSWLQPSSPIPGTFPLLADPALERSGGLSVSLRCNLVMSEPSVIATYRLSSRHTVASASQRWRHTCLRIAASSLRSSAMTKLREMPALWKVEEIPGGYRVNDAEGKAVAYCYGLDPRELPAAGHLRPTRDEARRVASNNAELPDLLSSGNSKEDDQG